MRRERKKTTSTKLEGGWPNAAHHKENTKTIQTIIELPHMCCSLTSMYNTSSVFF
jgi:hypothetical protein